MKSIIRSVLYCGRGVSDKVGKCGTGPEYFAGAEYPGLFGAG